MTRVLTVVLLSGPISAGKTVLAENFAHRFGADHVRTSALIAASVGGALGRADLQGAGLNSTFQRGGWLVRAIEEMVSATSGDLIVVDSVRTLEQVRACQCR